MQDMTAVSAADPTQWIPSTTQNLFSTRFQEEEKVPAVFPPTPGEISAAPASANAIAATSATGSSPSASPVCNIDDEGLFMMSSEAECPMVVSMVRS